MKYGDLERAEQTVLEFGMINLQ